MTTLFINTDPIVDCNLCSSVALPVLPDAMDISTSTWPPINLTIGCNTDSVEMKGISALLRETDEIKKLEAQLKEKEDEIFRLRMSLNLFKIGMSNCYRKIMSWLATSAKIQFGSKNYKKTSKWPEQINESLSVSLQYFNLLQKQILNIPPLLTATGFSGFPKLPARRKFVNKIYQSNASLTQIKTELAPRI